MTIYTKAGDDGTTLLYNGKRVLKSDLRVEACGSLDELSSFLGLVISKLKDNEFKIFLTKIQKDLYRIMTVLSGKKGDLTELEAAVNKFEQFIDKTEAQLPKLNRFILPQGSELSAWFHILRTVCRRSERSLVRFLTSPTSSRRNVGTTLGASNKIIVTILKYFNRLSDLFFIMARYYNNKKELTI